MDAMHFKLYIRYKWPTNDKYNNYWTSISAVFASISIALGCLSNWHTFLQGWIGPTIVGLWTVLPPLYLWVDWVVYADDTKENPGHDFVKHNHDLARNIWLGLVVLLSGLFKVTLFK